MTLKRNLYYRRKESSIIVEGKKDGKTIFLWTLPSDPAHLLEIYKKASEFPLEKIKNLSEKISRLDYKPEKKKNSTDEVPTTIINRTSELDDKDEEIPEDLKDIVDKFDFLDDD